MKPVIVNAEQWFKNGDHSQDMTTPEHPEGMVVRHFNGTNRIIKCHKCSEIFEAHGWLDTIIGGRMVCPGDWVITGPRGDRDLCKPESFVATFDPVEKPI